MTRHLTKLSLVTGQPVDAEQEFDVEYVDASDYAPSDQFHAFIPGRLEVEDEEPLVMVPLAEDEVLDEPDLVNQPEHYTSHPSGVECIEVTEHMSFCLGNAVKYIWRAGLKGDRVTDLQKAAWYLQREIGRLQGVLYRQAVLEEDAA